MKFTQVKLTDGKDFSLTAYKSQLALVKEETHIVIQGQSKILNAVIFITLPLKH